MRRSIVFVAFVAALLMTACDKEESLPLERIVGVWAEQYPQGLQTEGFVTWSFDTSRTLEVRVYDAFAGDHTDRYAYQLLDDRRSLAVSGDILKADGTVMNGTFAIFEVVKLTQERLRIRRIWLNPDYESLDASEKNSFLLGGWSDVSFKRSQE